MNTLDIVKKYLKDNGYHGLAGDECGCRIDDLRPCDCLCDCEPGYVWECNTCSDKDDLDEGCSYYHVDGYRGGCVRVEKP